ncbi:MAG: serine/threonine protein kinase [Gemmatimonadota bacterium]|nr:serine/threonine protein kinase [Gemmatimonadota bacterium]
MKVCSTCGSEYPDDQKFCPGDGTALRSTAQGSLIGSVIADRYHIVKKLGEGGMGAVYLGEHVKMGRQSAIKVMSPSMTSDPDAIARFNREAANAARINHPNVCAIYDFGETPDGIIYLAMEFIEGEALGDVLDREGALAPHRAVAILQQTADALQAAHELGIVHRDLKPDNIMLARGRGGAELVKVVDFGIAKAMRGQEGQQVTKTGLVVGTPEYMSPEQLSGDVLDGRSDIYSLGLVFFRMLTGTFAFEADSAQEVMIKRLTDEPLPLARARPDLGVPEALQRVMDRALARMPGDRYDNAGHFAADAAAAVRPMAAAPGHPPIAEDDITQIVAGDDDATVRLAPTQERRSQPSASAPPRTITPTTPQPAPSPAPGAKRRVPVAAIAAAVLVIGGGTAATLVLKGSGDRAAVEGDSARATPPDTGLGGTPPGGGERPLGGGETPAGGRDTLRRTGGDTARPEPPTPNVDAVRADIARLGDEVLDVALRASAIGQLEGIYGRTDLPADLRGEAAAWLAQGFFESAALQDACAWIDRAIALVPANQTYRTIRGRYSCR